MTNMSLFLIPVCNESSATIPPLTWDLKTVEYVKFISSNKFIS